MTISINLDELLVTKFTRVIDNSGCFSFYNKKFQVISKTIPPKSKLTIIMSKKLGIKAIFEGKKYNVITCDKLPTHNSYKDMNEIFKSVEVENFIFATYLLSLDAKKSPPLLVT